MFSTEDSDLIQTVSTQQIPAAEQELEALVGQPLTIRIDWESASTFAPSLVPDFDTHGLALLVEAVRLAVADDAVRERMAESLPAFELLHVSPHLGYGFVTCEDCIQLRTNLYDPAGLPDAEELAQHLRAEFQPHADPEDWGAELGQSIGDAFGEMFGSFFSPFMSFGFEEIAKEADALDLESTDAAGNTALHVCGRYGKPEIAHRIIRRGAEVDRRNAAGETSLALAVRHGQTEAAAVLIAAGANLDAIDEVHEETEELVRRARGDRSSIELPDHYEQIATFDPNAVATPGEDEAGMAEFQEFLGMALAGMTELADSAMAGPALHRAVMEGDVGAIALQLTQGAALDATNERGDTALHFAVVQGDPELIELLVTVGADPTIVNAAGRSPETWAEWLGVEPLAVGKRVPTPTAPELVAMIDAFGVQAPRTRDRIVEALRRIDAADELVGALRAGDHPFRMAMVGEMIAEFGEAAIAPLLERVTSPIEYAPDVVAAAAQALGPIGARASDSDAKKVTTALVWLMQRSDLSEAPLHLEASFDLPPEMLDQVLTGREAITSAACEALGEVGDRSQPVIDALATAASLGGRHTTPAAIAALGKLGAGDAVARAIEASPDPEAALTGYTKSLGDACPPDALLERFLELDDRMALVRVTEKLSTWMADGCESPTLARVAIELACREDLNIRWDATKAIELTPSLPAAAVDTIVQCLGGESPGGALDAIVKLEPSPEVGERLAATLAENLAGDDYEVRDKSAAALCHLGLVAAKAEPRLIEIVGDREHHFREAAAHALGAVSRSDAAVDALVGLLKEEAMRDSRAAATALGHMGEAARRAVPTLEAFVDDFFAGDACREAIDRLTA